MSVDLIGSGGVRRLRPAASATCAGRRLSVTSGACFMMRVLTLKWTV